MQPKLSIIIPVYKVETVIEHCCLALFGQTLQDIEFIFVNDCTPDGSIDMILKTLTLFPARMSNVKILHQSRNSGVSACRQIGLNYAKGEYIIYCDSDDWPELDMYETMYNEAVKESAEVVCCDYCVEYGESSIVKTFPDKYVQRPSFNTDPIEGAVWNKLISRSLIDRCGAEFYQGINLGEDFGFVTPCRVMSVKTVVVHKPLYHYNQLNANSITHNYTKERFMQVVELAKRTEEYMIRHGLSEEYEKEICTLKFMSKMYFLVFEHTRDIELWKSLFPEANRFISDYDVPLYIKVASWSIVHGLDSFAKILLYAKTFITGR